MTQPSDKQPQGNQDNPVTIVCYLKASEELNNFQKGTQRAFYDFIRKLRADPTSSSLHVEPLHNTKDREIRSVRITHGCRAIVAKETRTNTYTILHLDEGHDDAYAWVKRHRLTTDMLANTIRLEDTPDPEQLSRLLAEGADDDSRESHEDPFAAFSDDDLTGFGIPEAGVNVLRAAPSPAAAKAMSWLLADNARSCIELALEGYSKADINSVAADSRRQGESYGLSQTASTKEFIDAAGDNQAERDMRTMLTSNGTQQQFVVLTDDQDLKRLMDAPLAQWRIFLHPTQRAVVDADYSGPARVTGGAGTGKTVVAMHRACRLAQSLVRQGSDRKVLLTTFTANLADDILDNMRLLCSKKELERIEVINLDKWLWSFLNDHAKCRILYKDWDVKRLWQTARQAAKDQSVRTMPVDFFIQEWEQVVLANDITDPDTYLHVPRRGRGERLTGTQRESVWAVMERYHQQMDARREYDQAYAMQIAAKLLDGPCRDQRFAFVVVDEGQDFSAPAYRLLRSLVDHHSNDIFITSDNHQQLYGNRVSLKRCGIQVAGRSSRLKVNYRTTNEIKTTAEAVSFAEGSDASMTDSVLKAVKKASEGESKRTGSPAPAGSLDYSLAAPTGVFDDAAGEETFGDGISLTHGEWPEAIRCKSWDVQFRRVSTWIGERLRQDPAARPEGICVIVRDNQQADNWADALRNKTPYGALRLDNKTKDGESSPGIRVATMYRAKGLEFDYVVVPDIDQCPPPGLMRKLAGDDTALRQLRRQERNLLYVAMTRPRKELLVTAVG